MRLELIESKERMFSSRCISMFCLVALLIGASCTKRLGEGTSPVSGTSKDGPVTSESVVRVTASPIEVSAGGSGEAVVNVTVQTGYHINANPPTYAYLKATELELYPSGGISVGFITYPSSTEKKFPFAERPLAIYEGDTQLKVFLKATPSAVKRLSNLPAKLKVQACDDQVCYAPGVVDVFIPVTVK